MRPVTFALLILAGLTLAGPAPAATLAVTYTGTLLDDGTPFTATFVYDPATLVPDPDRPSVSTGSDAADHATLTADGNVVTFDSSDYFYFDDADGGEVPGEFGIRGTTGRFLYLKVSATVTEGEYVLPPLDEAALGQTVELDPATVAAGVAPVPLPMAGRLMAGALLLLGLAGHRWPGRRRASRAKWASPTSLRHCNDEPVHGS